MRAESVLVFAPEQFPKRALILAALGSFAAGAVALDHRALSIDLLVGRTEIGRRGDLAFGSIHIGLRDLDNGSVRDALSDAVGRENNSGPGAGRSIYDGAAAEAVARLQAVLQRAQITLAAAVQAAAELRASAP